MKLLLGLALKNPKHRLLIILVFFAMLLLTITSYSEMIALGLITDYGKSEVKNPKEEVQDIKTSSLDSVLKGQGKDLQKHWLNNLKEAFNLQELPNLVALIFFVAIFKAGSMFANNYTSELVAIRVSKELRLRYFEHIQALSMSFYNRYNVGSLAARVVADAEAIARSLNAILINYLRTPFTLIGTLTGCFFLSWKLSIIIFIGLPLLGLPIYYLAKRIKTIAKRIQKNQERFTTVLLDFLRGVQSIKVFAVEKYSLEKYKIQNDEMAGLAARSARYSLASRPILHVIGSLFLVAVLLTGLLVFEMQIAELLTFCGFLWLTYEPIKKFADENAQILRGIAAAERMFEVIQIEPEIQDAPDAVSLATLKDRIVFKDVHFRYRTDETEDWTVANLNFTIRKGQTVAIVGPTGSGKSTIAQLFPRLYEVQQGEILIDGLPLQAYTQESLRRCIAFVPQFPYLFLDSVANNISFGGNYSMEEIRHAAKRAYADEFIQDLPEGYDMQLQDSGKNLSGGQQQRLAIARALIRKAPILILDEATSSLDGISENRIKQAIIELHGEVTQIIIAHRFSTIEHADIILYIQEGKVAAQGTKEHLLKCCPEFRLMWENLYKKKSEELQHDPV